MPAKKLKRDRVTEPIPVFREPPKLVSVGCTRCLTTSCAVCAFMKVEKTKHEGSYCTKSKCERGFWIGGNSWNRLVPAGM